MGKGKGRVCTRWVKAGVKGRGKVCTRSVKAGVEYALGG